ncbi:MAG: hypothetical protein ACI35W_05905 [Anaeroplasmataceae bacterium]
MKFIKKNLVAVIATLLVIVAICLLFGDCVQKVVNISNTTTKGDLYSGFQAIFGYSVENEVFGSTVKTQILDFSFMNLLALILAAVGAILAFIKIPFGNIISGVCMVVGGVFFFLMGVFTISHTESASISFSLKACAIISGVLTLIAGLIVLANPYISKKTTKKKRK